MAVNPATPFLSTENKSTLFNLSADAAALMTVLVLAKSCFVPSALFSRGFVRN